MGRLLARPILISAAAIMLLALGGCDFFVSDESRVRKANELRTQGDYAAAVIELKKVLQKHPDNRDARFLLGEVSLLVGEPAAAEKELRRAQQLGISKDNVVIPLGQALLDQGHFDEALLELEPSAASDDEVNTGVQLLRGEVYLRLGRLDEADRTFRGILVQEENSLDARIGLARVQAGRGDLVAADAFIDEALSKDPAYARGWLAKGQLELARSQYARAEEAFSRAVQQALPAVDEFIARNGLVECQWRQGKSAAALDNVERLMQLAPEHPRPKYLRALIAYGAGDYETARDYLQQILRSFSDYRPATLLLGATHYAQGELEQADMYLSSVLAVDPSSVSARKLLAATRLRQRKPQEAIATLAPALTPDSDDSQLLALMGRASLQVGAADAGLAYLERSAQRDPSNQALQMQLAAGYVSSGDLEHAVQLLESMPASKEGDNGRELLLILAYLRKGDSDGAVERARRLAAARPDDPGAQNLAGTVYMATGQLPRAREQFETVLGTHPDNLAALMNLGRLEVREGKQDSARARFERVAELSPKNSGALIALAQLSALRGDQSAATQFYERAAAADPQAIEPKLMLIRHYLETDDPGRARSAATAALDAAPGNATLQNALGIVQMAERQYDEAAASFAKAIAATPGSASFSYNLARAQLARNNVPEAKRALAKTLELQPDYVAASAALAHIEMREGNSAQALSRARALQQDSDTAASGHSLEGDLHMLGREFGSAARAYDATSKQAPSAALAVKSYEARRRARMPDAAKPLERWLSQHPDDAAVRLALAQSRQEDGRLKEAIGEYELLLKSNPDSAVVLNNLALAYHDTGDSRALATAERAYQLQPEIGAIADTCGWLLVRAGELQRGVEVLRKAVQLAPELPDIRYHLAVALAKTGAKEEARRTLTELVDSGKAFQDLPEARQLLQEL
jgi:putative PEP-CTERM system TPR-repeat lipoprotein